MRSGYPVEDKELNRAIGRLSLLHSHYALLLLKNSLSVPKLLYLLRTTDYSGNSFLSIFDDALRSGLSSILQSRSQWDSA